jgi:GAF domain-containing protein
MQNIRLNYEALISVTQSLSRYENPDELVHRTADSVRAALGVKGCALFLINKESEVLELAASSGLSDEYLNKGTVSALKSIAASLKDGPVAVFDVKDDPRIQYPEAAQKEGIASILSLPVLVRDKAIGAMRIYTEEKWDFTLDDVNFCQALAQISGVLIEMSRFYQGQKEYIETLHIRCESPML